MPAYKLVHIADLHLDYPFRWLDDADLRAKRRSEQKHALRRALDVARAEGACAVLVAGDLLEGARFSAGTVNFLKEAFEWAYPIPVFIAAGNHDPLAPDSPYLTADWPSNVRFMPAGEVECFEACDGLLVCGRSHARELEQANPLSRFEGPDRGATSVLLLHASYAEWGEAEFFHSKRTFPLPRESLERAGFDYVALGHHHSRRRLDLGAGLGYYPGSPVAVVPSETGPRYFLLVEVERGRAAVKPVPTGAAEVREVEVDCTGATNSIGALSRAEETLRDVPKESLLLVRLVGEVPPDADLEAGEVAVSLRAKGFKFVRVLDETVPAQDIDRLLREESVRGEFVRLAVKEIERARAEGDEERVALLEAALRFGLQAFSGGRVRAL